MPQSHCSRCGGGGGRGGCDDPEPPPPPTDQGNGPDIIYIPKTEGFHVVSISIQDATATDDGANYPAVQLWAVDAKTWAEMQEQDQK